MEETQKRKKKDQIQNRNAEVRKMNAKAMSTEQDRLQELLNKMKYKKKRSKSCINKSENIFLKIPVPSAADKDLKRAKREKSNENNKTSVLSGLLEPLLTRKNQEVTGRNAPVTELNQLKREIDDEIRRDRREGRLDVLSPSSNPAPLLAVKKEFKPNDLSKKAPKQVKDLAVKDAPKLYTALRITEPDALLERKNRDVQGNIKLKIQQDEVDRLFMSTSHVKSALQGMNTTKIQKFIEKQKRRNAAKNKLELANQHEKVMKVHQNLVNLHNFTVKDRRKHTKETGFFNLKKTSNQQNQLMEHIRSHPIANLKIGKKRKHSPKDDLSSDSDDKRHKIKVQQLRLKNSKLDQETDLLEQTIQIDSSRMEVDNSIINIYRKLSGSRKSSNDSKLRSALRSSGGESMQDHRRSQSGGHKMDHPPLKVLKQAKISPTSRGNSNERTQSSGSAFLRRKHQYQLEQVERQRHRQKLSPDLRNVKEAYVTQPEVKPSDTIDVSVKQHLPSEQFESLEPTRTAKQIKKSVDAKISSIASQNSVISFDQKVQELAAKYGKPGESEPQLLVRLHTAAIKLQLSFRKYMRQEPRQAKPALPPKRSLEVIELEVRKQTSSDQNIKLSSRDGTGQSLRKGLIPTLDLDKLGSQKRAQVHDAYTKLSVVEQKEENDPPASTSRSIFARHTFRDFLDKIGVSSIDEVSTKTFPEMMKVREQAIQHRHRMDETKIDNLYRQKQISPRTYDRRRFELEKWVDKERDEVRRTKRKVEEEQQKTARILRYSAENSEQIKRILNGQENNYLNVSTRSHHNVPQTLTDRLQSARLSSKRGEGQSNIIALIYEQEVPDLGRQRQKSFDVAKKSQEMAVSDDSSKKIESKPTSHRKSPLILSEYVDHIPIDAPTDPFSNLIVANPNALKSFPHTAQKPTMKNSFANSNQKSKQTSDNPESLRDLMSEHDEQLKTPHDKTNTNRSLDIDGAIDPELEEQFNQHINTQLLGKIIQEERESMAVSDNQSSAKPSKKSDDHAPAGPFRQRRQAYEVSNDKEKPLYRVTSQQQLQDRDVDLQEQQQESQEKGPSVQKTRALLQIPEDEDDLARKVMEVSPFSNSHSQIAFSKEDLKDSIRSESFFINNLNKINSAQGTSFEDLQDFNSQQKDLVAQLQGVDSYEMANINFHGVTTPLSEGNSDKIRIEFGGQPLTGNDGFQPAVSFYIGNMVGAPVSPMSNESIGGIKCGATSLSSNTSEEKSMPLPGILHVIHETSEEQRSRHDSTFVRGDWNELQETNLTLHLSALDTTDKLDSELAQNVASQDNSSKKSPLPLELTRNLPKELIEGGERLADELFQLLLVELSIDLPSLVNRHVHRSNEGGLHFKDQAHGIKTDLFAIERYVEEVKAEIMNNAKEFMDGLSKPLTKEPMLMLNMLQNSEIGSCEHFAENYPQILHLDLYLTLEKRRKEKREKQIKELEEGDVGHQKTQAEIHNSMFRTFLAECEHIHNKVLFDCINDSLLQFKPYGKEGPPLSWTRQARRLKPAEDFTINEIFEVVKHDLFAWAIFLAGTLARREMVYQGVFDQDLFDEIREKKLLHMIYCEMIETEPKWLNYEFELAQVKIDVGDMILEQLVNETIAVLAENASRDLADAFGQENGKSHNIEDSWPSAS